MALLALIYIYCVYTSKAKSRREREGESECMQIAEIPFSLNARIVLHYNLFCHTKQQPSTRNRFRIKFKFMYEKSVKCKRKNFRLEATRVKGILIESMNVCNLVVLDTWRITLNLWTLQVIGNRLENCFFARFLC